MCLGVSSRDAPAELRAGRLSVLDDISITRCVRARIKARDVLLVRARCRDLIALHRVLCAQRSHHRLRSDGRRSSLTGDAVLCCA